MERSSKAVATMLWYRIAVLQCYLMHPKVLWMDIRGKGEK